MLVNRKRLHFDLGLMVGLGAIIGVLLYAFTGEAWLVAFGPAIGIALDTIFDWRKT
jgi:hypothetical protein